MLLDTQLDLGDVTGNELTEFDFMTLLASAQVRRFLAGKSTRFNDVTNAQGRPLHLGNFMSHLVVPSSFPLRRFRTWDHLSVGVEVYNFGGLLFDAAYSVAAQGELTDKPDEWKVAPRPYVRTGASFWIEDDRREPEVSSPRADLIAVLPPAKIPESVVRSRDTKARGYLLAPGPKDLVAAEPIPYRVFVGRDVAAGKSVVCTQFIKIMDVSERMFLTQSVARPLPAALLNAASLLERETYLFGRCYADDLLEVTVRARFEAPPAGAELGGPGEVELGVLTATFDIRVAGSAPPIVMSRVRRRLALPADAPVAKDARELVRSYAV